MSEFEKIEHAVDDAIRWLEHEAKTVTPGGHGIGWRRDRPDHRDHPYVPAPETSPPPVGGLLPDQLPPIWNQSTIGSCTAHGSLRAFVAALMKAGITLPHTPKPIRGDGNPAPFSRLEQYYNERLLENTVSTDSGAQVRDAFVALSRYGVGPESLWPYNVREFAVRPPQSVESAGASSKVLEYKSVKPTGRLGGPETVALSEGKVVVFGFQVPAYFEQPDAGIDWDPTSGVPLPVPPDGYDNWLGGHCVAASHYNFSETPVDGPYWEQLAGDFYVIENSWDVDWGIGGRFFMDSEWFRSKYASSFWVIGSVE